MRLAPLLSFIRRSLVRSRERLGHDAGHEPPEHDPENKNRGDPNHEIDQGSEIARGGPSSHLRTIGGLFALQITHTTDAHARHPAMAGSAQAGRWNGINIRPGRRTPAVWDRRQPSHGGRGTRTAARQTAKRGPGDSGICLGDAAPTRVGVRPTPFYDDQAGGGLLDECSLQSTLIS